MIVHEGFEQFRKGSFENSGDNLFVDAKGVIRRIQDNDMDGDGLFDIVFPNSHGYIERAPVSIFKETSTGYEERILSHDSSWRVLVDDVDEDGYLDLIVCNGENGVTSELKSYIYWGGPNGLTDEFTELPTQGAYDAVICKLPGSERKSIIFTTAWMDHHNAGVWMPQKFYSQTEARKFIDTTENWNIGGYAVQSLAYKDLNGDGYPDLVVANLRKEYETDTDSMIYWGTKDGFIKDPQLLPTHAASCVQTVDLNNDGFDELIFSGDSQINIYWNRNGVFSKDDITILNISGTSWQFCKGGLPLTVADVDADGIMELVIGTAEGVEIRKVTELEKVQQRIGDFNVTGVWVGDIKGSGNMDIIACRYRDIKAYDANSYVYWGSPDGYKEENRTPFLTHGAVSAIAADFDGDGIKEVVFGNSMSGPNAADPEFPVFVYSDNGERDFTKRPRRDYPESSSSYVMGDFNNDGLVELAFCTDFGWKIFPGTPTGPDPHAAQSFYFGANVCITGIIAADVNRDGWLDVLICGAAHGSDGVDYHAMLFYGSEEGFSEERVHTFKFHKIGESGSTCILFADINGDGWLDFLYGETDSIGVYYGSENGFSDSAFKRITLKDTEGALPFGITAADIDHDGKLELIVTTAGHYYRVKSHLYILRNEDEGYPEEEQTVFETGGSTGFTVLADLYGSGELDLILPFYSTTESRELPLRIFRSDGNGSFDWENPVCIDCLASIGAAAVDLNGNGYPDLFICCHRNDVGHIVDSLFFKNDGHGLDLENPQRLMGYGPHCFTLRNLGNGRDRSEKEDYTSPVFQVDHPKKLRWEGETLRKTRLSFQVRFAETENEVADAEWITLGDDCELILPNNITGGYMQYKVSFWAPGFVGSPKLYRVEIE